MRMQRETMASERPDEWPRKRTMELVEDEIEFVRQRRDQHLDAGQLRLAGEDCFELEQLTPEYSSLTVDRLR